MNESVYVSKCVYTEMSGNIALSMLSQSYRLIKCSSRVTLISCLAAILLKQSMLPSPPGPLSSRALQVEEGE